MDRDDPDTAARRRAQELEDRSYRHTQRDRHREAALRDRTVAGHERAALLHDRLANLGWGDVDEHRERADAHREDAAADRSAAAGDGADEPDGPTGPYLG
jgi:hypothetical protein